MIKLLLNLLLPVSCGVCGKNLNFKESYICKNCFTNLEIVNLQGCRFCGKLERIETENGFFCSMCAGSFSEIDEIFTACRYGDNIKKLIINFKYNNKRYLGGTLAGLLVKLYFVNNISDSDIVTGIPLSTARFRERGYNQSEILAKSFSKKTQIKLNKQILNRKKSTLIQVDLNRKDRLKNMESAFWFVGRKKIKGKKIILIDDVATTGATLQNAAKVLKNAGAEKITVLIIAHG